MHSVVDWAAFGYWRKGKLQRAFSVSPDDGVMEDIGDSLDFETPYWEGVFPVEMDAEDEIYTLPFHPQELAEASLVSTLGFAFEGGEEWVCDPDTIPILRFKLTKRAWWKFWLK